MLHLSALVSNIPAVGNRHSVRPRNILRRLVEHGVADVVVDEEVRVFQGLFVRVATHSQQTRFTYLDLDVDLGNLRIGSLQ